MPLYEYRWNPGTPQALGKIDPEAFAVELDRIERAHGAATAAILVDEAKSKAHIAHDFIYHVGERRAARLHYEQRAGLLVRSLEVRPVVDSEPRHVRARIHVQDDDGARYASVHEVALRSDLRERHRESLLRRLNALRTELVNFDEFAEVVDAISHVLERDAA